MNIQGGGISFEINGSNEKLKKILEESKAAITRFGGDAVKSSKDIDAGFTVAAKSIQDAFKRVDAVIDENLQGIKELRAQNEQLQAQAAKAFNSGDDKTYRALQQQVAENNNIIRARQQIIDQGQQVIEELSQEEQKLQQQKKYYEDHAEKVKSLKTQLRECREQLALMEANGQRGTEEFRRLQQEAGRLTDAIGDANTQARIFSHDNANLQGVISGISGVAGAFTAAQGAMSLFIGENEDLQKAMLKVQSLMSVTMGLQQVYNTLNKDSAFMLTIVAKAKDMLTAANARLAAALGVSTAAAQALMATLTLGLSAAITAIVVLITKLVTANQKAEEQQKKFNDEVAKAAGKPLAAYAALKAEWESLAGSLKDKEKWIADNASRFEELGLKVLTAKDAEDVLIRNSKNFVEACIAKAKALAAQQLAAEKYEEIIKKQAEVDAMPDKVTKVVGAGRYARVATVDNSEKADAKKELADMQAEARKFIEMQTQFTKEEQAFLSKLGSTTKSAVEGSVVAAEAELARLRKLYDNAANDTERKKYYDQIVRQQKLVDSISFQKPTSGGSGDQKKDPYLDMLQKRKEAYAQYARWSQSEDEVVRQAASKEFAELLKEGDSYIDYLEKQRDAISKKATKTATDIAHLAALNNEIAEVTKKTVLSDFETQLNNELQLCDTIGKRLELIEQRRKEIEGDNSDVGRGKADILKEAEDNTMQQAKEETAQLLQEYAGYLNEKLEFEESYTRKRELLTKAAEQAKTEKEKAVALAALAELERKKKEFEQRSGSERYDELKEQYQTYQEQVTAILKKHAEEREEAEKAGNLAMIAQINAKEQAELSKLAAEKLKQSESWNQLFSDLSTLSTSTINKLMAEINSQKVTLSAQFNPADLKAINEALERAKNEIHKRNPFLALKDSLKELRAAMRAESLLSSDDPFVKNLQDKKKQYQQYTEAVSSSDETLAGAAKEAYKDLLKEGSSYIDMLRRKIAELEGKKVTIGLDVQGEEQLEILNAALDKETGATKSVEQGFKDAFSSVGSSIDLVKGSFDSVIQGMEKMGITMDEETQVILGDLSEMMGGAQQVAEGIATGNPLSIIQGSVSFLSSAFDMFNSRDRRAERSIKEHERAVKRLGNAYKALQHAVDNALGNTVYQNQNAMIRNLRAQQAELRGAIEDEKDKKETDWDRIADWEEQIAEAGRQIEDIIKEITESITQTNAKSLADELSNALVDAFQAGTSAAKAFDKVAGDVLRNAVLNALKLQFLEQPLQAAIKQLQKDMGYDNEGNGSFDGLTKAEQDRFRESVKKAGANFAEAFKLYEDLFDELNQNDPSTLSGAIKGASQESIDLLAGQANAVRMNQVTAVQLLRDHLQRLSNIDTNVGIIAGRLVTIINRLSQSEEGLRGQGITD